MHVSSIASYFGVSAAQSKQQAESVKGAGFATQAAEAADNVATDPYAEVFAKYDLQNITPAQIDELTDELFEAGRAFDKNMLMLRTRGAEFQSHLAELTGAPFDPNKPVNLIQSTKDQITMAHRYGGPTEALEEFLSYLNKYDQADAAGPETPRRGAVYESIMHQAVQESAA